MRTASLPRLLPAGLAIVLLAGCRAAASPAPTSSSTPSPTGTASATPSVAASPAPTSGAAGTDEAAKAWLLVGRRGEPGLRLVLTTTGEAGMDLPLGAPRPKWDRVVTATPDDDTTIVADIVVQPGFGGPEVRVPGRWRLPTIGLDPTPTGRSIDGSTIALVEGAYDGSADASPSPRLSRFAIVEHHVADTRTGAGDAPLRLARIVELPGDFAYDALSPDGRILYVVEHLDATAGGRYQVRAVDVPTGVMRDAVIVDKTNPDERMAGTPIAQVRRPDGLVLTLYRGPEHPFIHALMAHEAWAVCIDLPAAGADHADAALDWDLAASPRGGSVFAVNATLGLAVDVDPAALAVRRSATIGATADAGGTAPAATDGIELAKFGHIDLGTVGRRTVVSADGSTLFAAGAGGIAVIGTKDLGVVRRDLPGSAIDGLGITPDGAVLFALLRGSGEIAAIATADGRSLGTVPGSGYDRLLAVAPW